jgi:hypothetical protein
MSHLSIERLAALADERPTADESAHLVACAECAQEVEAHRSLLALAHEERESMRLPLTRWDSLAPALKADGLISSASASARRFGGRGMLQVAAALLLVAGGAVLGRVSAVTSTTSQAMVGRAGAPDSLPVSFVSVEEAQRLRQYYREGYQRAVTFLSQQDSGRINDTPAAMKARLAALDRVAGITREALNDAPFDPVLNDFFLNSHSQREATLRELNTVLPQNVRLNSF